MSEPPAAGSRYERLTAEQMDEQRIQNVAYQYLCRSEEAKRWMEACSGEELPAPTESEEASRNGVISAKSGQRFAPAAVPSRKIYDPEQLRYKAAGLQFRHTDNINHWRNAMTSSGLPAIFYPETTDVYDRKNMPRAVYCIHALSLYSYRSGSAPPIYDLYGKVKFTDEEINNMKSESDKYGIQMPAFSKIGGISANELSVDEAAVHAAVVAINEAVDRGEVGVTASASRNPAASLTDSQEASMGVYQEVSKQARSRKAELAACKRGQSEDKDMYEEYSTQSEIQNHIRTVNVRSAVEQVDEALDAEDELSSSAASQSPCLALRGLRTDNGPWYSDRSSVERQQKASDGSVDPSEPVESQDAVSAANQEAQRAASMLSASRSVNASSQGDDPRRTVSCSMNSDLQSPEVFPSAAALYHRESQSSQRRTAQGESHQEELFVAVEMSSAVASINQASEAGHQHQFSSSLVSPSAGSCDVDLSLMDRYSEHSAGVKQQMGGASSTWNQSQEEINNVNGSAHHEQQQLQAVGSINKAVMKGDAQQSSSASMSPSSGSQEVVPANACRYSTSSTRTRQDKVQRSRDPGAESWLADIQEAVKQANQQTQKASKLCSAVAAVNQAVKENRVKQTSRVSSSPESDSRGVSSDCAAEYQRELSARIADRTASGVYRSPWVRVQSHDGTFYYFQSNRSEGRWEKPDGFKQHGVFLSQQEIQEVVSGVSAAYSRGVLWRSSEAFVVRSQARCRGFSVRRRSEDRRRFSISQTPAVVVIQSHWRRFVQQGAYRRRSQLFSRNWRAVVKIQASVRMWLVRRKYLSRLRFFSQNVDAVIKIQAFFRASRARHQYRMLVHSDTPPSSVVRKFLHSLDLGDGDIREEAELSRSREEVVRSIRFNRQSESDLDSMDSKIGLSVRNRATLQEVVSHCKKLTKKNKEQSCDMMDVERSKGSKASSRDRRERSEAYQHSFYSSQTQPLYSAQVIFSMPQSRSTAFMEMSVFSSFNYGSDHREAFSSSQSFTEALRYEIRSKVEKPQDVITGNPTVIKMLVNFYRHARGQNASRDSSGPASQDVSSDQTLSIRTDPVEVYKTWINQTETQTGTKSSSPYEVSAEDASSHPEVQRRIDIAIINSKNSTDRVFKAITCNLSKLPYGSRYTAKVLRDALKTKFPAASENESYKIVGNSVYYRYMNPAIVAPDGFDVVDRSAGSSSQAEQRHISGSIARMSQHAAANKHFHGDGYHVGVSNQYITQTHNKFRKFSHSVCDVPEPEERFSMDEYSESSIVDRPVIYISVSESLNTHQSSSEHQEVSCSDRSDPLRSISDDLGPVPSLQELIGDPGSETSKTEVSSILTNKFDIFSDSEDEPDARGSSLSTKQLIMDVIRTQAGDSSSESSRTKTSPDQEVCHDWSMQRRARRDARTPEKMKRNPSFVAIGNSSSEEKKRKISRSLRRSEALGVSTPPLAEDQISQMVAKDIRQQRSRRQRRGAELQKSRETLSRSQEKSRFHSEQVDFYKHYITSCSDNSTADRKATNRKAAESQGKKKLPASSYSAARSQEKGVSSEIEDSPSTQFKNVLFDITPGSEKGSFSVKARFLGVQMEEFQLKYQDSSQSQYEGVAVMKMFDKAKVNVNLLIFLLNKKFFKK